MVQRDRHIYLLCGHWEEDVLPDQEAEDNFREELLEIVVDTGKYLGAAS